jgi:hypothetical protein
VSVRDQILHFLRDPAAFAQGVEQADQAHWLAGLTAFAEPQIAARNDYPLRPSQVTAWRGLAGHRAGLIQGPPGTGKTYALSWMALGYLHARMAAGLPCRVLVTAFTLNAIANLLEAIQGKAQRYFPQPPEVCFVGNPPGGELAAGIRHVPLRGRGAREEALAALQAEHTVVGCTVWSLNKVLDSGDPAAGPTAPLFHLVCIDEASQMVVSHGLMALAGLAGGGRVLVAGDDKQLPPVRALHEQEVGGRRLGGSLYDFLKSAQVAERSLDETFRLNGPLTAFPASKFYPGRYRSAEDVAATRLTLDHGWEAGLEDWERVALDPEYPLCILLHDGPTAGTANPFEVVVVTRLVRRFHAAMPAGEGDEHGAADAFWQRRLAVISPHRAQNAAIRAALADAPAGERAVVETVDRIQGKERDAIIASYTVSDPEFALAEAAFIFGIERLNVTITRARSKLVLLVSRRLLDVVPSDEEALDAAQILRELVFDSEEVGSVELRHSDGRRVPVNVRVRGFVRGGELPELAAVTDEVPAETLPEWTRDLEDLLKAIQAIALASSYGTAADFELKNKLYREVAFTELRDLFRVGHIQLDQRHRKSGSGSFWAARPLAPPRIPLPSDPQTVRLRLEEAIAAARRGRYAPFYTSVRQHFVWMDEAGEDMVWPTVQDMAREGLVRLETKNGSPTVEWVIETATDASEAAPEPPAEDVSDEDFQVLNALEDLEGRRINFGIFEAWSSASQVAAAMGQPRTRIADTLRRLARHGHLLLDEEGRVRSRMAELAREVRYVKQRFRVGDADSRPFLVRSLKVALRTRDKPVRDQPLSRVVGDLRASLADDATAVSVLDAVEAMLRRAWDGADPPLAGFQARALRQVFLAWLGREPQDTFVVTADTGSGKTEAAVLPLIAGAALDALRGVQGVRAVLVYPRVRLAANQAQRLAGYLATLAQVEGMPTLTLGIQNYQVPQSPDRVADDLQPLWESVGTGRRAFPFFACPACGKDLHIAYGQGNADADRLTCTACAWECRGWVGTKQALRQRPPTFFLPVTESLHQWQNDPDSGGLFGDRPGLAPPRAVLADEIHLFTHIHGAQVGYALRRLLARAGLNAPEAPPPLAIGMSATLGEPARVWRTLVGREAATELRPEPEERQLNPRGREYFYFVQPEVESRGRDIAGAATSIQSLMCLAHGMRRRTGKQGGYRALVFLDSIDKLKRLHSDYQDAEETKRLAQLRTRLYGDDPGTRQPRRQCCGQPAACDRFRDGECWTFAATDPGQVTARGRYRPGSALAVAGTPVYSGTRGRVEEMVRGSDTVFATSSLEVGYDDPDIALVYQHYAPNNLASFIQRKGRGGRGADDRPVTGVTLSPYSPRDSWYFRRPQQMLDSTRFEIPLNVDNYFVRRGQVLATLLDALAHTQARVDQSPAFLPTADRLVRSVFGEGIYRELGVADLEALWSQAIALADGPIRPNLRHYQLREALPWVPRTLFATVNLPELEVRYASERRDTATDTKREDIGLVLDAAAPGNMTRRYGRTLVHWIPPTNGRAEWLSREVYRRSQGFTIAPMVRDGAEGLLRQLPLEARGEAGAEVHPSICRPGGVDLETAGQVRGDWMADWYYDSNDQAVHRIEGKLPDSGLKLHHKSRGTLKTFTYVEADDGATHPLPTTGIEAIAPRLDAFHSGTTNTGATGLTLATLTWGADAELKLEDPNRDDVPFTQVFVHPTSRKTLLHGYQVETEGIRLHLDSRRLTDFVQAEVGRLRDHPDGRWHRAQMLRYLVGSRARAAGINTYQASRAADLLFSAAGAPDLRAQLSRVIRRWDGVRLRRLLQQTYEQMLFHHPLLSERRVNRLADDLGKPEFRQVFADVLDQVRSDDPFAAYLRSVLVHSVAVRLKQAFVLHGHGDERQVIVHAKLPIQFGNDATDTITVAENGAQGDGTTRLFVANLQRMREDWSTGALAECPNASEDAILDRLFSQPDRHAHWRTLDPRASDPMTALADDLGIPPQDDHGVMQAVIRALYGTETVHQQRFELYDLHREIRAVTDRAHDSLGREPSIWEQVSATVGAAEAEDSATPNLTALLRAYEGLEDATQEESLSPQSRLADQVYRLSARLCVDGCQACLHAGSDVVQGGLVEASVSRRLLERWASM